MFNSQSQKQGNRAAPLIIWFDSTWIYHRQNHTSKHSSFVSWSSLKGGYLFLLVYVQQPINLLQQGALGASDLILIQ